MTIEIFLFALFATTSIVSATGVILIRDPVKAAMSLIACFFSLACLFMLQSAELLAVLEVLVYAGAIMVLFVFVIMLVEHKDDPVVSETITQRVAVPVKVVGVGVIAASIALLVHRTGTPRMEPLPEGFGSVRAVGLRFFEQYLFHFEFTSILLLVGIVGAVMVSRRRRGGS
ncbi:NADH-quinone oxidoreductase subunit J [Myxococcota bacterium]|nr:NADH-quinone oxidoreductase subunit J [Myxococcota bacterium]